MKFRAERDALLEAITTAGRAAATRGTALPALTGVRLEVIGDELHLAGTDLDVTIQVQIPVSATEAGVCVIPARLATDIVRGLEPGSVSVEVDDNEARIAGGPTHYAVRVLPPEEFLRLPQPSGDAVTLAASDFAEALSQVVPAASRDEARPILTGVLMAAEAGGPRRVATDSYRPALGRPPGTSGLHEGPTVPA